MYTKGVDEEEKKKKKKNAICASFDLTRLHLKNLLTTVTTNTLCLPIWTLDLA